jgi:hypothetical protein
MHHRVSEEGAFCEHEAVVESANLQLVRKAFQRRFVLRLVNPLQGTRKKLSYRNIRIRRGAYEV